MAKFNVNFKDNSDFILRRMGDNIRDAADSVGEIAVEAVQNQILYGYKEPHGNPPHTEIVDTGRLFDSVSANVANVSSNAFTVEVGAGTHYAKYVHDGTSKLNGRPFITDGLLKARPDIKKLLADRLKQGIN